MSAATPEPMPVTGKQPVLALVLADLQARSMMGTQKYGSPLMTHNGRDALMDLYQEILDAAMYIRQLIEERHEGDAS